MNKEEILKYHNWLDEQYRIAAEQARKRKESETEAERLARLVEEGLCLYCESDNVVGKNYRAISGHVRSGVEHTLELETRKCLDCGLSFEVSL